MKKFHGDGVVTPGNLVAFIKLYFEGELEEKIKSGDLPKDWDKRPVKVI